MINNIIKHIAFIMDGNRRYAKKNNFSKKEGYKAGMDKFLDFVKYQVKYNIPETSFWALSTENWRKRGKDDLNPLYELLENFFEKDGKLEDYFFENKIKIEAKGDLKEFEDKQTNILPSQRKLFLDMQKRFEEYNQKLDVETEGNYNFKVNVCVNYGGNREILDAFKKILNKIEIGELKKDKITESTIKENIYFADSPAPEVIVRPGDAPRLSGFMSWDSAYSEIYFTKKLWPELCEEDFLEILNWFESIKRNFGK